MSVRHLLWTGGWDSTYRLLDLVLGKHQTVQPHYLVRAKRGSAQTELRTMARIRAALEARWPDAAARVWPHRVTDVAALEPSPELNAAYQELRAKGHLGSQYVWLAQYALQAGVEGLELSVHIDDKAHGFIKDAAQKVTREGDAYWELADTRGGLRLFSPFRFPLLQLTKLDMQERAAAQGFGDLLELTWFCHHPRRAQPCGVCGPCRYTIEEGLGRRVPLIGRMRYRTLALRRATRGLI